MGNLNNIVAPPAGQQGLNFPVDWVEKIDDVSPNNDQFAVDQSRAELVAILDWDKQYDAILGILGYQYTDPASLQLRRICPLRHPRFLWMHATRIYGMKGQRYDGRVDNVVLGAPFGDPARLGSYATYRKIIFTVSFEALPYEVLRDDETGGEEYNRFLEPMPEPGEDVIEQQAGELIFAEGGGGTEPTAGGTRFPRTIGIIQAKNMIRLRWHKVPEDFISPNGGITYPQFDAVLGKVNDATFLQCPAGTLLARSPRIRRYPQSVNPRNRTAPSMLCDVDVCLQFFDPSPRESDTYRGHNLMPYRDKRHYLATHDGNVAGRGSYDEISFAKIFKHHSA